MSLQTLIDDFLTILLRDDCSETQAEAFIGQGIRRLQREVRLPCMEREVVATFPTGGETWVTIPSNLLEIVDVLVEDSSDPRPRPLVKMDYRALVTLDPGRPPHAYAMFSGRIYMSGSMPAGSTLRLLYYGTFSDLATREAENEVTVGFPEAAIYAGLVYAASAYTHPSKGEWAQDYTNVRDGLIASGINLSMNGGPQSIQPMYSEPA